MNSKDFGKDCPYSQFEGYDLLYSPIWNYVYSLRRDYGEYGEPQGYVGCDENCNSYFNCSVYQKQNTLDEEVNKNGK